ncbi:MAG: hypothetical protein K5886_07895 [Lachnospiraceae bacterium]|nr:hypothetical protein [Lachnospiraceae bacterium]
MGSKGYVIFRSSIAVSLLIQIMLAGFWYPKYYHERKKMMRKHNMIIEMVMIFGMTASILSGCGNSKPETVAMEQMEEEIEEQATDSTENETNQNDGLEINDETYMKDLFDYFEANIEHVATDFPDIQLDDSYKNSESTTEISPPTDTMETMSDGLALAGPFFTVDRNGKIVGINYGGRIYSVCGITAGTPMSEAAEIAKSHGFTFSRVEITHGSAKYVTIYDNGGMQLCITSDADGDFGKTEESDVTGNVDGILLITNTSAEGENGGSVDFSGSYTEPDSGRCRIEISKESEGSFTITVNWANDYTEERIWAITGATYGDSGDKLVYTDALCYDRTTDDEGNYTDEDIYDNGSGSFWMTEGGMLGWKSEQSDIDGVDGELLFDRMD